jgi:NTP pyrophosphatase (non-canonical NTP hydrolase)
MKTLELIKHWAITFGKPVNKTQRSVEGKEIVKAMMLVDEELKEVKDAQTDEEMKKEVSDLFWVVVRLAQTCGIDLQETTKLLYDSNMSKLCRTEVEAKENQAEYWQGTHQHGKGKSVSVKVKKVGKRFVLLNADNKVMKPNSYKPVEF